MESSYAQKVALIETTVDVNFLKRSHFLYKTKATFLI